MNFHRSLLLNLAPLFLLILAPTAHGQGDPSRGATLWSTTYKCSTCHATPPGSDVKQGVTSQGIINAINNVMDQPMQSIFSGTLSNNPTDLADLAAYIALTDAPPPTTPDINQHGLTGSWYNAATNGQGVEVEIFPSQSYAQVSWFTFDTTAGAEDHQRWYTIGGSVVTGQSSASLAIYQNIDGNFDALPVTNGEQVGTATLSFSSCTSGELTYAFTDGSGRTGSIPLTRLTQNVTCSITPPYATNADFALSGNWYEPATAGQGFTIEVNAVSATVFVAWYTYEPSGTSAGAAGQRWYTAQPGTFVAGSRSIPVTIYETTGGAFNMPTPPVVSTAVGSGTLVFQSCTAATFSYAFTEGSSAGLHGTISLSRVSAVPPGCTS